MAISSVKTSSVVNGYPKSRSFLVGNATSATPTGQLAVAVSFSPYVQVYGWYDGFGPKYSNPSTLPASTIAPGIVRWSKSGNDLAICASDILTIYSWNNVTGFGTRHTSATVGGIWSFRFSNSNNNIATASIYSPYINVYPFTSGVGIGTKYADPSTLPTGGGRDASWSPSDNAIAVFHSTSPFVSVYPWSAGFGTKYANPSVLPPSTAWNGEWSPSGNDIAVAHSSSPFISVYPWSNGFGTKYANPATLPVGTSYAAVWSPSGNDIAVAHTSSPFISVYPFTSGTGFGTKYADPIDVIPDTAYNVQWSPSGNAIMVYHAKSPGLAAWKWSNGFGKKYDSIEGIYPGGYINDISFK